MTHVYDHSKYFITMLDFCQTVTFTNGYIEIASPFVDKHVYAKLLLTGTIFVIYIVFFARLAAIAFIKPKCYPILLLAGLFVCPSVFSEYKNYTVENW